MFGRLDWENYIKGKSPVPLLSPGNKTYELKGLNWEKTKSIKDLEIKGFYYKPSDEKQKGSIFKKGHSNSSTFCKTQLQYSQRLSIALFGS